MRDNSAAGPTACARSDVVRARLLYDETDMQIRTTTGWKFVRLQEIESLHAFCNTSSRLLKCDLSKVMSGCLEFAGTFDSSYRASRAACRRRQASACAGRNVNVLRVFRGVPGGATAHESPSLILMLQMPRRLAMLLVRRLHGIVPWYITAPRAHTHWPAKQVGPARFHPSAAGSEHLPSATALVTDPPGPSTHRSCL